MNKDTNLTQETISNENGEYTLTNLQPGRYDVKVGLQGFREFVKTNVPVTAGQISRVEAKLEIGALTETVTVESAAQLLQTDKSDLHTELKSKEIINLPLNQYRNYQALINLVPGATPASFQNAQTDTPGRSLRTNVNGMDGQNNNTRIDGASSVNIWLPHHAGYVAPAETIDTVNIATNNFDAAAGMAGGAAITLVTKSGTNNLQGLGVLLPQPGRTEREGVLRPDQAQFEHLDRRRHGRRPDRQEQAVLLRGHREQSRTQQPVRPVHRADGEDAQRRLQRSARGQPELQAVRPGDRQQRCRPDGVPGRRYSRRPPLQPGPGDPGALSCAEQPGHEQRAAEQPVPRAQPEGRFATTTTSKVNWNRTTSHQIFAKFSTMQANVDDLFYLGVPDVGGGNTKVYVATVGNTWTISPTMVLDGNIGMNKQNQTAQGGDFGTNFGSETFGIPGTNGPDPRQSGMPVFRDRHEHARQRRRMDATRASRDQLHGHGEPDEALWARTRSGPASTSSATS